MTARLGRLEALAAPSRPDDSGDAPLTGEDLIGDLDPGWLDWRENQEER